MTLLTDNLSRKEFKGNDKEYIEYRKKVGILLKNNKIDELNKMNKNIRNNNYNNNNDNYILYNTPTYLCPTIAIRLYSGTF